MGLINLTQKISKGRQVKYKMENLILLNAGAEQAPSIFSLLLPFIIMAVVFYFLLIRPQQKRQKAVNQMQADLKKGDKIVTIGGLHGVIHALDEATIQIDVGGGRKLTYDRSAIKNVVEVEETTAE